MSISTPAPPPQKKKSGCGCFGCGCFFGIVLILLLIALIGGTIYVSYLDFNKITTTVPADVPAINSTEESYAAVEQKMAAFQSEVKKHQPSSIHLTSDDINNLIAHTPDLAKNNIRAFVTLTDNEGHMKASVSTDALTHGGVKDRFLNFDIDFGVEFDQRAKSIGLVPHTIQVGDQTILGGTSGNDANSLNASLRKSFLNAMIPPFNQIFNQGLRKNPDIASFLDHAKSVEIKDSELVIESQ